MPLVREDGSEIFRVGLEALSSSSLFGELSVTLRLMLDGRVVAVDTVRGTAVGTQEGYTQQAARAAGIDLVDWNPFEGFVEIQNTVQRVYDYYRDTYLAHQEDFVWLGMARMAGGAVWDGLI